MKATLGSDELYRRVDARSALEGRHVGAVAVELLADWVAGDPSTEPNPASGVPPQSTPTRFDGAPWVAITEKYVKVKQRHDMENIRAAIGTGWESVEC